MRRPITIIFCVIGVFFLFVSLPFTGISYLLYNSSVNSLRNTIQTNGTIVATCNGNTNTTCTTIVSFSTRPGKTVQFSSNFSSNWMHQGDTVLVNYHPKDPQDAVISSFTSLWLFPVLIGGIGGFLLLVALVFFFLAFIVMFNRRSRSPSVSTAPITAIAPPTFSDSMIPTALSDSIAPTAPSVSTVPTAPLDPTYPYHNPGSYNPYR